MIKLFKRIDIAILLTFGALLTSYPYVFQCIFGLPEEKLLSPIFLVLLMTYDIVKREASFIPDFIKICLILQVAAWFIYSFLFSDSTYITRIFYIALSYFAVIALEKKCGLPKFVKINNGFLALQAFFGAIAFILVFLGILSPIIEFQNANGHEAYCYILTCTNVAIGNVIRVAGYFDEPGALANWGMYALIFNKLFFKNKYIEYTLLICLLFTLSAAYFIQVALYLLFFYVASNTKKIIPVIFICISFLLIFNSVKDNDVVAKYTTERFHDGQINSTRYDLAAIAKQNFLESPVFGIGAKHMESTAYMGDNPYEILAKDGIVGYILTYLPLLCLLFKVKNKSVLYSVIILFAGYMQRPFHMNLIHYLVLLSFCIMATKYKVNTNIQLNK